MLVIGVAGLVVSAEFVYHSGKSDVEDTNDDRRVGSVYKPEL